MVAHTGSSATVGHRVGRHVVSHTYFDGSKQELR